MEFGNDVANFSDELQGSPPANDVCSGRLSVRGVKRNLMMMMLEESGFVLGDDARGCYSVRDSLVGKLKTVFKEPYRTPPFEVPQTIDDLKKTLCQELFYDPSELRLKWEGRDLNDDAILNYMRSQVGPSSSTVLTVEVVASINSQSIEELVRSSYISSASIPNHGQIPVLFSAMSDIIETVRPRSAVVIAHVTRSLADVALSETPHDVCDMPFHFNKFAEVFRMLHNKWWDGNPSNGSVAARLNDHLQSIWDTIFAHQRNPRCTGLFMSWRMKKKLMALTQFIGSLFEYRLMGRSTLGDIFSDLLGRGKSPCDLQVQCAIALLWSVGEFLCHSKHGQALLNDILESLINIKCNLYHRLEATTLGSIEQCIACLSESSAIVF